MNQITTIYLEDKPARIRKDWIAIEKRVREDGATFFTYHKMIGRDDIDEAIETAVRNGLPGADRIVRVNARHAVSA